MKTKNIFRMLLVAAALLMGANNVKAAETPLWDGQGSNLSCVKINGSSFSGLTGDVTLRVYTNDGTQIFIAAGSDQYNEANDVPLFYTQNNTWIRSGEYYNANGYFAFPLTASMITELSAKGLIIKDYQTRISKVSIITDGSQTVSSLQEGENVVSSEEKYCDDYGQGITFSSDLFQGASAGNTVRIYGDFSNGEWATEFMYVDNGWKKVYIPEWGNNYQANAGTTTVKSNNNGSYVEFELTNDNLPSIKDHSTLVVQGHKFTVKKVVIYVAPTSAKTTPTLSFGETTVFNITYGDSFTGPTATCDVTSLEITYESNKTNVAEVTTYTGVVTIKNAGQAIITAKTQASDEYNEASASYTINVAKVNYTLSYSASTASAVLGQSWTAPTLNNPSNISVTYSSTNTGVATIDQNGNVTLLAAGETTIKANYTGDNNHEAKEASYVLTVSTASAPAKQDVTLAFSQTSATATIGESFTAPTLTATSNGQQVTLSGITYSSSDTSVATVNASTGAVTLVGEGTTTITATFAGNDTYNGTSVSYTLTVSEATPSEDDYIDVSTDGNLAYYGYRTYVTTETVDFSRSIGVEGYYTTSYDEESVTFTQIVGTCPRGVALLLKATSGATEYKLLKSTAAATAPTGNKLVAGTDATVSGSQKYVLTYHAPNIVFAEVNIQGAEVDAEHAYLDLSGSNARGRLNIRLIGESTGISTIQSDKGLDGAVYNLRGQRVENPTKGLYIINGKKVVIK